MYAKSISIYGFKCFGKAEVELLYPDRHDGDVSQPNINLILGDNGGGKSSVLRAIAIAALAPALINAGFVAYRLARRDADARVVGDSLLKLRAVLDAVERTPSAKDSQSSTRPRGTASRPKDFLARIRANARSQIDLLSLESTPDNPISDLIYDDYSPAFFVVGYGATRRVESGNFSAASEDRRRGRRYQRVASLFEDHVALRPIQSWFPALDERQKGQVVELLNRALPDSIRFDGAMDGDDYLFTFDGVRTPFPALSDGYKAFVGWVGDLLGHMTSVAGEKPLAELPGIVLVDEIDLHLHPSWQRDVVARLANAFPRFQFVFTSHSPLVAASVQPSNVIVTGTGPDGLPSLDKMQESLYGRSVEAVLMSPYFGLDSARPIAARQATNALADQVAAVPGGDVNAAEAFLRQLTQPLEALRGNTTTTGRR